MGKFVAILTLISMSAAAFAAKPEYIGNYSEPTNFRFFGYTKEMCLAENGYFEESAEACYFPTENTISIQEGQQNKIVVEISVIFGAGNMRDFYGIVTRANKNLLTVREASTYDNGIASTLVKNGCVLYLKITNNTAFVNLGKNCDGDLSRASGAIKSSGL